MNMSYKIYQLKDNEQGYKYIFRSYNENDVPSKSLYNEVYSGEVESDNSEDPYITLEDLYMTFNTKHPADFKGHSLSVSDVVELDGKYYYCDSFGYAELKNWK